MPVFLRAAVLAACFLPFFALDSNHLTVHSSALEHGHEHPADANAAGHQTVTHSSALEHDNEHPANAKARGFAEDRVFMEIESNGSVKYKARVSGDADDHGLSDGAPPSSSSFAEIRNEDLSSDQPTKTKKHANARKQQQSAAASPAEGSKPAEIECGKFTYSKGAPLSFVEPPITVRSVVKWCCQFEKKRSLDTKDTIAATLELRGAVQSNMRWFPVKLPVLVGPSTERVMYCLNVDHPDVKKTILQTCGQFEYTGTLPTGFDIGLTLDGRADFPVTVDVGNKSNKVRYCCNGFFKFKVSDVDKSFMLAARREWTSSEAQLKAMITSKLKALSRSEPFGNLPTIWEPESGDLKGNFHVDALCLNMDKAADADMKLLLSSDNTESSAASDAARAGAAAPAATGFSAATASSSQGSAGDVADDAAGGAGVAGAGSTAAGSAGGTPCDNQSPAELTKVECSTLTVGDEDSINAQSEVERCVEAVLDKSKTCPFAPLNTVISFHRNEALLVTRCHQEKANNIAYAVLLWIDEPHGKALIESDLERLTPSLDEYYNKHWHAIANPKYLQTREEVMSWYISVARYASEVRTVEKRAQINDDIREMKKLQCDRFMSQTLTLLPPSRLESSSDEHKLSMVDSVPPHPPPPAPAIGGAPADPARDADASVLGGGGGAAGPAGDLTPRGPGAQAGEATADERVPRDIMKIDCYKGFYPFMPDDADKRVKWKEGGKEVSVRCLDQNNRDVLSDVNCFDVAQKKLDVKCIEGQLSASAFPAPLNTFIPLYGPIRKDAYKAMLVTTQKGTNAYAVLVWINNNQVLLGDIETPCVIETVAIEKPAAGANKVMVMYSNDSAKATSQRSNTIFFGTLDDRALVTSNLKDLIPLLDMYFESHLPKAESTAVKKEFVEAWYKKAAEYASEAPTVKERKEYDYKFESARNKAEKLNLHGKIHQFPYSSGMVLYLLPPARIDIHKGASADSTIEFGGIVEDILTSSDG